MSARRNWKWRSPPAARRAAMMRAIVAAMVIDAGWAVRH
jgi:hypothetical protein